MDLDQRKEQFSRAYVRAVASVAGFALFESGVDDDSIDLTLAERGGGGTVRSPKLDAQLKCTSQDVLGETEIRFGIKVKNYNDLRAEDVLVPRVLAVVLVPGDDPNGWITHSEQEMVMRRCGYWVALRGLPPTENTGTITVSVPRANVFSPASLQAIMGRIGAGALP